MEVDQAARLISRVIDSGRLANAYIIVGDVRGNANELTERILAKLFPDQEELIARGNHPDVIEIEPTGKLRIITVDQVKEGIVEPLARTAYAGGWRVGIIRHADRLCVRHEAANAFLKILEEPPPKTLFLLLTERGDDFLPTIASRCQRIELKLPSDRLEGEDYDAIAELFLEGVKAEADRVRLSRRLSSMLANLEEQTEPEDFPIVRKRFFNTILSFARGWMVEGRLVRYRAFHNVEVIEDAYRQCGRSIKPEEVISVMLERMVFP